MAKKDPPKKIKAVDLAKYKAEGYKFKTPGKSESGVSQEYYELPGKKLNRPPSTTPGGVTPPRIERDPKKYEGDIIQKIKEGYDPREFPPGIIDPNRLKEFMTYYEPKMVYTEPEPTITTPIPIRRGLNIERKEVTEANPAGGEYKVFDYPDVSGGYSKATRKYFIGDKEITAPTKESYGTKGFTPIYKQDALGLNEGENLGTKKLDVITTSPSPLGTKVTEGVNLPIRIQSGQDVRNIGLQTKFGEESYNAEAKPSLVPSTKTVPVKTQTVTPEAKFPGVVQGPGESFDAAYERYKAEQQPKAKGGLIGKIKGYTGGTMAGGTTSTPPQTKLSGGELAGIGQGADFIAGMGSNIIDAKAKDEYGRYKTYGAGIGSGALGGAGKGAAAGAAFGPVGLAIGAGFGAIGGGIMGGIETKKGKDAIADEKAAEENAKLEEQRAIINMQRQEQANKSMQERASYLGGANYAKGGLVGKIRGMYNGGEMTGETADQMMSGNPSGNYNTDTGNGQQLPKWARNIDNPDYITGEGFSGGSPMFKKGGLIKKMYNGGELTPYDYAKDPTKIPGYVADANAMKPMANAKSSTAGNLYSSTPNSSLSRKDKKILGEYGIDPSTMTTDQAIEVSKQYAHDNRYTDKERGGFIGGTGSGGINIGSTAMFNKGGVIKGKGTGTSDSILAKVEPGSFITPAKNADKAKAVLELVKGGKIPSTKKANLNQKNGEPVKLSDGEFMFTPEQRKEIIAELGEDVLEALAPDAENGNEEMKKGGLTAAKARAILHDGTIRGKKITDQQRKYFGAISNGMKCGGMVKEMAKGGKVPKVRIPTEAEMNQLAPKEEETQVQRLKRLEEESNAALLNKTAMDYEKKNPYTYSTPKERKGITGAQLTGLLSEGSSLINGLVGQGFSRKQINKATKFLAESGKRPVDVIDSGFQDTLNKATAEAKYGLSAAELAALNNENVGLRNREIEQAKNLAGGSAANAYAMTRGAINESFGRGLKTTIANRNAQLAKQAQANSLTAQKAEMNRRLFEDTMGAWQQNQSTGARLLGAGIENKIGSQRYNEAMRQLAINRANEQGWLNNIV